MPSDPSFNAHQKRERLPTPERLATALPHLGKTYAKYGGSSALEAVLREDARVRFASLQADMAFAVELAFAVVDLVEEVAKLRNLARF